MIKRNPGPAALRPSLLRADDTLVGRTQGEIMYAIQNAKGSAAYSEALAAEFRKNQEMFQDCPKAIKANRIGRFPKRDVMPATNASSLYNSDLNAQPRKR